MTANPVHAFHDRFAELLLAGDCAGAVLHVLTAIAYCEDGDPVLGAARELLRGWTAQAESQTVVGSTHQLIYEIDGGRIHLQAKITAIDENGVPRCTLHPVGKADPKAMNVEIWARLVPLIETSLREIAQRRRLPSPPSQG